MSEETLTPSAGETIDAPVVEPIVETPPVEGAAPPAEGDPPPADPPKPKKTAVESLQGRVGYLTKANNEKDARIAELESQQATYRALVEANARPAGAPVADPAPDGREPPPPPRVAIPAPGTAEFDRLVDERATAKAAQARFDADCNEIVRTGLADYKETWQDSVSSLQAMGLMRPDIVEAALATGDAAKVLNTLGQDLEEATRIGSLSPIRMAAELTKMATRQAGAPAPSASRAPPPIRPLGGAVKPEVDIASAASGNDMQAYVAARKAQGARWAR